MDLLTHLQDYLNSLGFDNVQIQVSISSDQKISGTVPGLTYMVARDHLYENPLLVLTSDIGVESLATTVRIIDDSIWTDVLIRLTDRSGILIFDVSPIGFDVALPSGQFLQVSSLALAKALVA